MRLTINSRRVLQALTTAFAVIITLNVIVILLRYEFGVGGEIFDKLYRKLCVNYEQNLPSYFNALLLLFASIFTGLIHLLEKESNQPRFKWFLLSLAFLFLSLDESASIHEFFVTFLTRYIGIGGTGVFSYAWVIVYGLGAALFATYLLPSLIKLPSALAKGMVISGAIYVGGAIGFEMVGSSIWSNTGDTNIRYALVATLEESLEMGGLILFIRYLLVYVRQEFASASLAIK